MDFKGKGAEAPFFSYQYMTPVTYHMTACSPILKMHESEIVFEGDIRMGLIKSFFK